MSHPSLHARILNLPVKADVLAWPAGDRALYATGHKDARHAAAELAQAAEPDGAQLTQMAGLVGQQIEAIRGLRMALAHMTGRYEYIRERWLADDESGFLSGDAMDAYTPAEFDAAIDAAVSLRDDPTAPEGEIK